MLDDVTSLTLQTAVAGLSTRQQVTANNIANLETPNFRSSTVDFESSLANALAVNDPTSTQITTSTTTAMASVNGNNVSLADEIVTATKTVLQEKLMTGALNDKYGLLNTVMKG